MEGLKIEQLTLSGAAIAAVIALWRAYQAQGKQFEMLLAAQSKLMGVVEKALERNEQVSTEVLDALKEFRAIFPGLKPSKPE